MQKIKINDRFSLCYDDKGDKWLVKREISKKGKMTETNYCGYHWHFEHLLNCFAKKRLDEKTATTVKGALKALTEVEQEIKALSESIGKALDLKYKETI